MVCHAIDMATIKWFPLTFTAILLLLSLDFILGFTNNGFREIYSSPTLYSIKFRVSRNYLDSSATRSNSNQPTFPIRQCMSSQGDNENDSTVSTAPTAYNNERNTKQAIEALMARYDPILLFASKLLPSDKAADASALYAWCRRLDEICDNPDTADNPEVVMKELETWQARFDALWTNTKHESMIDYPQDEYLMDLALKDCIEKYQGSEKSSSDNSFLTRIPFDDMIEGMKSDAVTGRRIQTLNELELYAYQVAGTVGLMLLPLLLSEETNVSSATKEDRKKQQIRNMERAREPAICLGQAIQLVNILRDATQDAKLGRIYLPLDMLRVNGVNEDQIFRVVGQDSQTTITPPNGYTAVVQEVSDRARELLAIAESGKDTLPPPLGPLFVQIIVELYRDYLDELRRRGYDNLSSNDGSDRVKIGTVRKIKASLRALAKVVVLG